MLTLIDNAAAARPRTQDDILDAVAAGTLSRAEASKLLGFGAEIQRCAAAHKNQLKRKERS